MDCNCKIACPIPACITTLEIGRVEPELTGLVLVIKDNINRVQKIENISPQSDGLLIVNVSSIALFFSPNFTYELSVLYTEESEGFLVPITIGTETVNCVSLSFVQGESTKGVILLADQNIGIMQLAGTFSTVSFIPVFAEAQFIVDWGDGNSNILFSGYSNAHTYALSGLYTVRIRGDFSKMTEFQNGNLGIGLTGVAMPEINSLTNIRFVSNHLTSDNVNTILQNLDKNGLIDGSVNLASQSPAAPPTFGGLAAVTSLENKGWTVTTDV